MSDHGHPSSRARHEAAEDERVRVSQLERLAEQEAEVRRLLDERWRRRILPMLPSVDEQESDFGGCIA